jgi:hypothetical protein
MHQHADSAYEDQKHVAMIAVETTVLAMAADDVQ